MWTFEVTGIVLRGSGRFTYPGCRGALVHTGADRISGRASISGRLFLAVETKTRPGFYFAVIFNISDQLRFCSGKKVKDCLDFSL